MDASLIEVLGRLWNEGVSFVVVIGLSFFSWNRMKRLDDIMDARLKETAEFARSLAEIEKETLSTLANIKDILLSRVLPPNGGN